MLHCVRGLGNGPDGRPGGRAPGDEGASILSTVEYVRTRFALIGVGLVSLAAFVVLARSSLLSVSATLSDHLSGADWLALTVAGAVLLLGHALRAARTKVVLDNVRQGSLGSQFQALGTGYFFDILLPLRLGEVVRSFLMAKKLRISFLYTLLAVTLERLIDVILVATVFLCFSVVLREQISAVVSVAAIVAVVTSLALIGLFVLLVRENRVIMRLAWRLSSWLNTDLENRARFKIWSVIFGFQRFFRDGRQLGRYAALVVLSWACYVLATAIAAIAIFPSISASRTIVAAAAPYAVVSPSVASGAPAPFLDGLAASLGQFGSLDGQSVAIFAAASWGILNVPILIVGLASLLFLRIRAATGTTDATRAPVNGYANKLLRDQDISQDFPMFLESYFQRERLSQVLHKLEVSGDVSLVRLYKGGSNAVTMLALGKGELYVKKMVPLEHAARLKNQHDWLAQRESLDQLVNVLREDHSDDYYAIDLEYRPGTVPLFDYLHVHPFEEGAAKLSDLWAYMYRNVYDTAPLADHSRQRDAYVRERLLERLHSAAESHEQLGRALGPERIRINGRVLDNFHRIMRRIQSTETAWDDLAMYQESTSIHGDLTVDNILIDTSTGDPLIIDPSDDNEIRGPVIDFARHMQSLQYGCEFLNLDQEPVGLSVGEDGLATIVYPDRRSARYAELADYVTTEIMTEHLAGAEQRAVLFHVGLFYGRMLTHRVAINPDTALKYYAVCVVALNRFLDQYALPRQDEPWS